MSDFQAYKKPLPIGVTLQVFSGDELIFSSGGKWLMPLFELEKFLSSNHTPKAALSLHDTAIGKAAAVLIVRMGITRIHGNLTSELAKTYVDSLNEKLSPKNKIQLSAETTCPRLMCSTEEQLSSMTDEDEMYRALRLRAKLVQGVSVSAQNVSYHFGNIRSLSFFLPAGDRLLVSGENGAGKTTLLRLLSGLYAPDEGQLLIDEKRISALEKRTIGYIPQVLDGSQFSLSVEEVVSLGVKNGTKNKRAVIDNALRRLSALHLKGRSFQSLSGGEKQKVSLARCIAQNASLLLLDEPTAALDGENREMVVQILNSLSVSEMPTIIVVTHDSALLDLPGWNHLAL